MSSRIFTRGLVDADLFHATARDSAAETHEEPAELLLQAFIPHVSVFASQDTEVLMSKKGFRTGFWELLRPFGEVSQGRVTIRDSSGTSRSFEDFSIRFTNFGDNIEHPNLGAPGMSRSQVPGNHNGAQTGVSRDRKVLADVETIVELLLSSAEQSSVEQLDPKISSRPIQGCLSQSSQTLPNFFSLYVRRLLSVVLMTPHETFAHPVACIIATSSRNESPIEEFRRLYIEISQGQSKLPLWVRSDYLRYYVLVHDEDQDSIERSMVLYEQMKRHFGLHCHLLRLRGSRCAKTDDDVIHLSRSDWMSPTEELAEIHRGESSDEVQDQSHYIFESDALAIRAFIKEMLTQSVLPNMERCVSVWNDQVASRRRGLTGRFMNLSKRWAGFGGGSRSPSGGNTSAKENFAALGFYHVDSAEAIIRKLADYAFMLRDWKLAHATYDLLRSDFSESKAWKHHAAANEMAAVSALLLAHRGISTCRVEVIDQMLESAFYSYATRCGAMYGALRSLTLGYELLQIRGGPHVDNAAKWIFRLLESKILGANIEALFKERLAICYSSRVGVRNPSLGKRHRKSAAWSVLAAESWIQQAKYKSARRCLDEAQKQYCHLPHKRGISGFDDAQSHVQSMQREICFGLQRNGHCKNVGGGAEIEQSLTKMATLKLKCARHKEMTIDR